MSDYVQTHSVLTSFNSSNSWSILSDIEVSIKNKVESIGAPLKEWNIQINYGVKTGFNEAFIVDTQKRNEILDNCQSEDERSKTSEIIRPILRGRDIRRYSYQWANLWLINTHNGIKGELDRVHIEDYPAIRQHIEQYWDRVKSEQIRATHLTTFGIALIWTNFLSQKLYGLNCLMSPSLLYATT